MPLFPPARTLIVRPSKWHSLNKLPTLVSGGSYDSVNYPLSALTDGSGALAFRFQAGTGAIRLNLNSGNSLIPNILGVAGHNFDYGMVVNVMASTSSSMSPLLLNRGVGVRFPSFWLDLRGFDIAADYWQLNFLNNSRPVSIGEVIIATGDELEGILKGTYKEEMTAYVEAAEFEYGKVDISASGAIGRQASLKFEYFSDTKSVIKAVFEEAGMNGIRVPFIPETQRNDIWMLDLQDRKELLYDRSILITSHDFQLRDEMFGTF